VISRDVLGHVASAEAIVLIDRPDLITFVEPSDQIGAAWLYSLFASAGRVIMSRQ
jgi:hypothetical protein